MTRLRILSLLLLIVVPTTLHARIEPSFDVMQCAWHATDIVLASRENMPAGNHSVLETLKGDLKPGDVISVPEISGAPVVLFLKRDPKQKDRWLPASRFGGMKVSAAWIEDEQVTAFIQIHRGPPVRAPLKQDRESPFDPATFKAHVMSIVKTQRELATASALTDIGKRAEALDPFARSDNFHAREEAFDQLGQSGPLGLPQLRKMLQDDAINHLHGHVVTALAEAGGDGAIEELITLVEQELVFWRERAPALPVGWWNNSANADWAEIERLRHRYVKVLQTLYAFQRQRDPRCRDAVMRFRDYWRSLPQLEDQSGLNQMSEACDDVLKKIDEKA